MSSPIYAPYNDLECPLVTGSELSSTSRITNGPFHPYSRNCASGSEGKKKSVLLPIGPIGNSSPPSPSPNGWQQSSGLLESVIGKLPDLTPPSPTFGKKKLLFQDPALSSELSPCSEIDLTIGTKSETLLNPINSTTFPEMYLYAIIGISHLTLGHSKPLLRTMANLLHLSGLSTYSGAGPELVKVSEHGKRLVYRLTLRIPGQNGGAATKVSNMLSLTNFEELWTYPTSCDGLTGIQCVWSSKEVQELSYVRTYGLPAIWLRNNGTLI